MTKQLRKCVDMIKENCIKKKDDGRLFVECKAINNTDDLFLNDDEKEEFLTKIRKYGFENFEVNPIMDRINTSSIHHYEIFLNK